MNIKKRVISLLITMVMLFSLFPGLPVSAAAVMTIILNPNSGLNIPLTTGAGPSPPAGTATLAATLYNDDGETVAATGVMWEIIGNAGVVTLSATNNSTNSAGLAQITVTAVSAGTTQIRVTAIAGGLSVTSPVTVFDPNAPIPITSVELDRTMLNMMTTTAPQLLTATLRPTNVVGTAATVTWSSNNPGVASVNDMGLVTAHSAGSAVITVRTNEGGHTATCTVIVTSPLTPPSAPQIVFPALVDPDDSTKGVVPLTGYAHESYSWTLGATGGGDMKWDITGEIPTGMTGNNATGTISGVPTRPGTYSVTVTADNTIMPVATRTFNIIIKNVYDVRYGFQPD
jgi:hypothetical protein